MGLPMCQRLLNAGHDLTVWNRSADKCRPLREAGAKQASHPAALAASTRIIMLCLADSVAVEDVVHGPHGLLAGLQADSIIIDFSSIAPDVTRRLATAVAQKNAYWLDAPVSGGVGGAEAGALVIMAGGKAEVLERVRPVLAPLSQRVTHMGDSGAGQVSKICNQLIVAANAVLIAEAVALAESAGVDARQLAPALAGGFADSKPFQILAPRMSERRFEPVQWRVQTLLKDLEMAVTLSRQCGNSAPLAAAAAQLLRLHGQSAEGAPAMQRDLSSLIQLYRS